MAVMADVPVFINSRDRVTPLRELVSWLERAGSQEIYLLDNDSTYPPLLEYYEATPHTVIRLGRNFGKYALWAAPGVFERTANRGFVYSDPDIIPEPECPFDAVERFAELLDRYPGVNKAGFHVRIDDIPDHFKHKELVMLLEERQWQWPLERGAYYGSLDTFFALYRPGAQPRPHTAARTGPPYIARHTSYYFDHENMSEEDLFYQAHAVVETDHSPGTSNWAFEDAPQPTVSIARAYQGSRLSYYSTKVRWRLYGRRAIRR